MASSCSEKSFVRLIRDPPGASDADESSSGNSSQGRAAFRKGHSGGSAKQRICSEWAVEAPGQDARRTSNNGIAEKARTVNQSPVDLDLLGYQEAVVGQAWFDAACLEWKTIIPQAKDLGSRTIQTKRIMIGE